MRDDNLDLLLSELRRDEGDYMRGTRHYLYRDSVGITTVGYGRNTETGFSEEEATLMLNNDVLSAIKDSKDLLGLNIFDSLSEVRKRVIVNMCFNLGVTRLRKFKNFLKEIKHNNWAEASYEMVDSSWYTQVGGRAKRLVKMMREG